MKAIKSISLCALSAVLLLGCAACGTDNADGASLSGERVSTYSAAQEPVSNYTDPNTVVKTYDNKAYNEYLLGKGNSSIANQWEGYGIGDPFVMRWNGMYYLYVSSLDSETGVRGYKSADLVSWAPMTGAGLSEGYVAEGDETLAAYAPEVYYFNGTFYMYSSPGGNGHYIFTADNPEGPFTVQTGNFGHSIDGSVLIDDDEQMYFTYASNGGIQMARMQNMLYEGFNAGQLLNNTSIGGWTEGPYILKKDGTYFLTFTGNHVASDGYRIAYATATSLPANYRKAFTRAQNNPLALETESALKGVGHSSTVMGPDMDSYYLVYHYLNSSGGPNRSLGIDRLTFDGKMMSVAPRLEDSVKPSLPAFFATERDEEKFETADTFLLSKTAAPASFTAEYNVTGSGVTTYVFGYSDANNYMDVTVDLSAKTVKLNKTVGGTTSEVAGGTLKNEFLADKLHTVRVAARDGKVDVAFDNMTKIDDATLTVPAGRIGYKSLDANATVGYTAFSDVAMGMSDEKEAKQITSYVGAKNYLRDDTFTAAPKLSSSSKLTSISRPKDPEADYDYRFDGWSNLKLGGSGDSVSYLLYNGVKGRYGLELVYPASDAGKKIGVKLDGVNGGTVYKCTLPAVDAQSVSDDYGIGDPYVKAIVGEFEMEAGARILRLENVGDSVSFTAFRFIETANVTPVFENSLSDYVDKGVDYKTIWKLKDGGHYAKAGNRQLVYFGDNTLTDFTLEIEMKLEGQTGSGSAGIVFHARNYAASPHDSVSSMQGYYLYARNDACGIERLNYADDRNENFASNARLGFTSDQFYKIKIQVRCNLITVWLDGEQIFSVTDAWNLANGKIGLYTDGAAAVFKNLKIYA